MYAKIRLFNASNYSSPHDVLAALFETQATSVAQLVAGLLPANQSIVDVSNSFINTSKNSHGWTVDYSSGATSTRNIILKSACKDSAKFKYALLTAPTNACSITTGTARSGNALTDQLTASDWYTVGAVPISTPMDIHISSSPRHLFLCVSRVSDGAHVSSAVFEYVTNDGYFSETSIYCPVVLAARMDQSSNYASGIRTFKLPRYKNLRAANYPDVVAQQGYWETPYSDDDFNPSDNSGYDYIGTGTDRTPLLIPFGVCNRGLHAFVGGAISDLCDIYLGPTNVGGNFEETLIGEDSYMSIPINNSTKRLFVPKG